jgi:hypothetical protein
VTRSLEESRGYDHPAPGDDGWEAWLEGRTVSSEGIDLALVRDHLARTPGERLAVLERTVNDLLELRGGRWPEVP